MAIAGMENYKKNQTNKKNNNKDVKWLPSCHCMLDEDTCVRLPDLVCSKETSH